MKQDFYEYIFNDYLRSVFKKHLPPGYYVTTMKKEMIKDVFDDESDHCAFIQPILDDSERDWFNYNFDFDPNKEVKGFVVVNVDNMKELRPDIGEAEFLCGCSVINDIKYIFIHECRHAQQYEIIRNLFNNDITKMDKLLTLTEESDYDILENDACVYAMSYVSPLFHNYQKEADKDLVNTLYINYGKYFKEEEKKWEN